MCLLAILALLFHPTQDDKAIEALIAALDADSPVERNHAQIALIEAGEKATPRLRAALAKATLEQRTRIDQVLREIGFRTEEALLRSEGLPSRLARLVPGFRARLLSDDPIAVRLVLFEVFDQRKLDLRFDEVAALLRPALEKDLDVSLTVETIGRAARYGLATLREPLLRLASHADSRVQIAVLRAATQMPMAGAEEAIGCFLKAGEEEHKLQALEALRKMETAAAFETAKLAFEDPSPAVRIAGIQVFIAALRRPAPQEIRRLLMDSSAAVRRRAAEALLYLDERESAGDILALRDDPDPGVRRCALAAIGRWRLSGAREILLGALRNARTEHDLVSAIEAAGELGDPEALPALVRVLSSEADWPRLESARAIRKIGPKGHAAEILELAKRGDAKAGRAALIALSWDPPPEALALYVAALPSDDYWLRDAATGALGRARDPGALKSVREALKTPAARKDLLQALSRSHLRVPADFVLEYLEDPDPEVVTKAIDVVQSSGIVEALPKLEKIIQTEEVTIAVPHAIEAMWLLEGEASASRFLRLMDSSYEGTRHWMWGHILNTPDDVIVEEALKVWKGPHDGLVYLVAKYVSGKSTAMLVGLTQSKDAPTRLAAVEALVKRKHERGIALARSLLSGDDPSPRSQAAAALLEAGIDDKEAVRLQGEAVRVAERRWMFHALRPLIACRRPEARESIGVWLRELEQVSQTDERDMRQLLSGYPASVLEQDFGEMAAGGDKRGRRGAAWALGAVPLRDRDRLLSALLKDGEAVVRQEAVRAFLAIRRAERPAELDAALRDPSPEVRKAAVDVLSELAPDLVSTFGESLSTDPAVEVRREFAKAAGEALVRVQRRTLERMLDDPDDRVRADAALAVLKAGERECGDHLLRMAEEDTSGFVRMQAARALLAIAHPRGVELARRHVANDEVALDLLRARDREAVPGALRIAAGEHFWNRSPHRVLFAMNALTQPSLYRQVRAVPVHLREWKGTRREWLGKLSQACGIPFEIDPAIPTLLLVRPIARESEGMLEDEISDVGVHLNASLILEPGRVRVVPRSAAVAHWECWQREGK